jgi:DNA-binding NarL/FixJ family response regulator
LKEDAEKDLFEALEKVLQGKLFVSPFLARELSASLGEIYRGEKQPPPSQPLSTREREILKLIAEAKSSKEIGDLLCISARTVERHRSNIMDKLHVRKTAELVRYALSKGLI